MSLLLLAEGLKLPFIIKLNFFRHYFEGKSKHFSTRVEDELVHA